MKSDCLRENWSLLVHTIGDGGKSILAQVWFQLRSNPKTELRWGAAPVSSSTMKSQSCSQRLALQEARTWLLSCHAINMRLDVFV